MDNLPRLVKRTGGGVDASEPISTESSLIEYVQETPIINYSIATTVGERLTGRVHGRFQCEVSLRACHSRRPAHATSTVYELGEGEPRVC